MIQVFWPYAQGLSTQFAMCKAIPELLSTQFKSVVVLCKPKETQWCHFQSVVWPVDSVNFSERAEVYFCGIVVMELITVEGQSVVWLSVVELAYPSLVSSTIQCKQFYAVCRQLQ